jgi:hypothetical protein
MPSERNIQEFDDKYMQNWYIITNKTSYKGKTRSKINYFKLVLNDFFPNNFCDCICLFAIFLVLMPSFHAHNFSTYCNNSCLQWTPVFC